MAVDLAKVGHSGPGLRIIENDDGLAANSVIDHRPGLFQLSDGITLVDALDLNTDNQRVGREPVIAVDSLVGVEHADLDRPDVAVLELGVWV